MTREIKIWGERWLVRQDSTHAVSFLKVKKGYRCSWHQHNTKFNVFVVTKGKLLIVVEELGKRRKTILRAGETLTIYPKQWHEFRGLKNSEVIEEMYVEYDEGDINRKVIGSHV